MGRRINWRDREFPEENYLTYEFQLWTEQSLKDAPRFGDCIPSDKDNSAEDVQEMNYE